MNWPPVARGSQEEAFTQPRDHFLADPCTCAECMQAQLRKTLVRAWRASAEWARRTSSAAASHTSCKWRWRGGRAGPRPHSKSGPSVRHRHLRRTGEYGQIRILKRLNRGVTCVHMCLPSFVQNSPKRASRISQYAFSNKVGHLHCGQIGLNTGN